MLDILNPGMPGIYRFWTEQGARDYLRKWDGIRWLYGKMTNSSVLEIAETTRSDPVPENVIQRWIRQKFTIELVADLRGKPWHRLTPLPTQMDLFL